MGHPVDWSGLISCVPVGNVTRNLVSDGIKRGSPLTWATEDNDF